MRQILTLILLAAFSLATPAAVQDYDLVIANGRVIDPESGLDAVRNLGIRGNTIAAIGDAPLRGATVIDARGLVVAPGFIDLHRHGQDDENYGHAARDGVTSVFELEVGTPDVERWYREREPGRLINYGVAIGHIGVRIAVMGDAGDFLPSGPAGSAVATEAQVAEMAKRIDQGLRQGAVAVGFGTAYTPAASPWEVLEMFRVAGRHRAPAHIHVRRGVEGVQEALADAVATGTPLHIVHVNSTAGNDVGRMLSLISDAQRRGIDVTTEAYPYNRGSTRLESALYDNWERMTDAEISEITWVATGESLTRESLARYRKIGGSVIQRPGRMENVQQAINSPITMIASDGSQLRNGRGHPRATGTYSQVLGRYVRDAGTLTLMDALRKMTIMPARRLEARVPAMRNKGRLRVGADADVVVFDAQRVIDRSTYQQAGLAPDGIAHVIVNGTRVVSGGRVVDGVAPGRAIRAPVGAAASASAATAQEPVLDVLIRGGQVLDGTGGGAVLADVGIRGDRIAAVGQLDGQAARRTIDATGLIVAPGFIDLHTHSEMPLIADGTAQSKIRQGVTLDITGESSSPAPRDGLPADGGDGQAPDWTTFTGYFERLERQGISMNTIAHVASEQVRRVVMGYETRPANAQELARMTQLVARSMEEGAWGLVTRFESGGPPHPDEILAMAKTVAKYGGNYTSHIGSEGFEQTKEIQFAIRVAEEAKIPVHIFHFKIRGKENEGTIGRYIKQIEAARARGLNITANQYPYTAMFHGWSAFFPLWIREGGPQQFAARLKDPAARARLKTDKDFITWAREHGWWEGIVLARARTEKNRQYEGKTIAQIARMRGEEDPMETCITLMAEEGGSISGIFHTMAENDVRTVMKLPWVSIASDGSAINLDAPGVPHPRNYSTNARVLGYYARDQKVLTLPEAVRKMTALPASILGLADRGQVKAGFAADLAVFDPSRVAETNSFEKPKSYAVGVPYVLVNGVVVIDGGRHTGATPGKALRGSGAARVRSSAGRQ